MVCFSSNHVSDNTVAESGIKKKRRSYPGLGRGGNGELLFNDYGFFWGGREKGF